MTDVFLILLVTEKISFGFFVTAKTCCHILTACELSVPCVLLDDVAIVKVVLIRIYGPVLGQIALDRSLQTDVFRLLADRGLAPKLYCQFDDGRLQEFLHGKIPSLSQMQVGAVFRVGEVERWERSKHPAEGMMCKT
jgi:hypothetical protein